MAIDDLGSSAQFGAKPSVGASTPISGINAMTRRTAKEILLEVCAGRERHNQSHDEPVKHGDAPRRFHSPRHQPTPPRASIKARGTPPSTDFGPSCADLVWSALTSPTVNLIRERSNGAFKIRRADRQDGRARFPLQEGSCLDPRKRN